MIYIGKETNMIKEDIRKTEEEIYITEKNIEELSILNNKPKNCKDSSCVFISKALKLQKEIQEEERDQQEQQKILCMGKI